MDPLADTPEAPNGQKVLTSYFILITHAGISNKSLP